MSAFNCKMGLTFLYIVLSLWQGIAAAYTLFTRHAPYL